jgi:type I restriction enzyme, S subunit
MIPKDWSITNLGEVAEVLDPQPDHRTPPEVLNGIPYIGVNDFLPNGEIDVKSCRKVAEEVWLKQQANILVDEGGIIFGKIGTIGMPRMLPTTSIKYALSANVVLIKPKVNRSYILAWLRSEDIHNQIYRTLHTTSQPALGIKKIRELLVNIPPLLEQCRIAEVLGVWDESIDLLERLIGRVRSRKQGLMQQLLTGKRRFKEFEGSEWKKVSLEKIAEINPRSHPNNLQFVGEFVEMASVSESGQLKNIAHIDLSTSTSGYTAFINGDTLIAKITPCFENGKGALIEGLKGIGFGSTEFFVLRAKLEIIPIYLYYLTRTYDFGMRGKAMMQGSGGQQRVPSDFIRQFAVKLPSIPEQEKIAAVLSAADEEISTLEKQLAAYKQQKLGLMQQLLTGRIRI